MSREFGCINENQGDLEKLIRSNTEPLVKRKLQTYIPKIDECSSPYFEITPFPLEIPGLVFTGSGNAVSGSLEKKIKG